jgi:hypothetical protein
VGAQVHEMTFRPGDDERVYRGVLRLFPAEFRDRFGEDMVQLFHDELRDARSGRASGGAAGAWIRLVADVAVNASGEHFRRNRTVANSLTSAPPVEARILGVAGVIAGIVILLVFVVDLPQELFPLRLIVFSIGVIGIGVGVHRRQAALAPAASIAATGALVLATAFFLATVLIVPPGNIVSFWSGLGLWLAFAVFGAVTAWIGAVSRWGALALALGSVLTLTGIDRLGLVSEDAPTIFNTLSQVGIATMAIGWILLGVDLATRARVELAE